MRITRALARARARRVSDLRCDLRLSIDASPEIPVRGELTASFQLSDTSGPLAFDFEGDIREMHINGRSAAVRRDHDGHAVVSQVDLRQGENLVWFDFNPAPDALHRGANRLYSLFVPARACRAIPCFDQPDLRVRWRVALEIPKDWTAVSNAAERDRRVSEDRHVVEFDETPPLPTYLLALAAGEFGVDDVECRGRRFRIFHQERDDRVIARNRDVIAAQHVEALEWLERYTGIAYPFAKFDLVLIPSFQFTGMEHPGAVYYNAGALLLDESATAGQQLARASVIAHEAAHMWFGDFVTMTWFDDVWVKEILASHFAARIARPPESDATLDVQFLLQHYPAAYDVDRSPGATPIRQTLDDLADAGLLYGPMLYHKAPIALRHLVELIGEDALRDGLRQYLKTFAFGAASWDDLRELLVVQSGPQVRAWSRVWIESPGGLPPAEPSSSDPVAGSRDQEPLTRAAALLTLRARALEGRVAPLAALRAFLTALEEETSGLIAERLLLDCRAIVWRLLGPAERAAIAPDVETTLNRGLHAGAPPGGRVLWFRALRDLATSPGAIEWLERVWRREAHVPGPPLPEQDEADLACALATRTVPATRDILATQLERFRSPEGRARLEFLLPILSPDAHARVDGFERLVATPRRVPETWIVDGARWLHAPARAGASRALVPPALAAVREFVRTGDIFLPRRWLDATLSGYSREVAAAETTAFIASLPEDYPPLLRPLLLEYTG